MNKILKKMTSSVLLATIIVYTTSPAFAFTKDETVYSKMDTSGNSYNTIVNSHIINSEQAEFINDLSDLLNIINTNGDELFTQNENTLIWSANGNDIYYRGETQKELPIECNIKYELDGKEISANEIAGKTGKVKVTLEYTNNDSHTIIINGKEEILYTPFVVVCGTILNNEKNRNIEITHGKLIDDGSKTIALGIATPGLQESLNLSKSTMDIPNSIELTMDAKDFELGSMITYITPKVLDDTDLNIFDKVNDIFAQVDTLQNSSHQLVEGANTLKEGTSTYCEKSAEFNSALKQISNGIISANTNYSKIDDGIVTLNQNASTLTIGSKTISDGIQKISDALNTINSNLSAIPETQVVDSINQVVDGISPIILGINNIATTDNSAKIAQLQTLINQNNVCISNLKNMNTSLEAQIGSLPSDQAQNIQLQIDANKNLIALLEGNNIAHESTKQTLQATDVTQLVQLNNGLQAIQTGLTQLLPGIKGIYSIKPAINQLADSSVLLANGTTELSEGTNKIVYGIKTLADGSSQMKSGLNVLAISSNQLSGASAQLADGANTISLGATTLADGMSKFNDEGIDKIGNYINGNLRNVKVRIEKLQNLSENYNNFSMINENDKGTVEFILITDSLKADNTAKKDNTKNNDEE